MQRIIILVFVVLMWSCKTESKLEKDIAAIDVAFDVERFETAFYTTSDKELSNVKQAFPFLFPNDVEDAYWINKKNDTLQQQLFAEVSQTFDNLSKEEEEITALFQHLKYYYKTFNEPRVITVINSVDYRSKVIVNDTLLLIALDNYLGSDHEFYSGIYDYLKQNFKREQIVSDLAETYAEKQIFQTRRKSLLEDMIYAGKALYFKDMVIPFKTDEEKIGYTTEQLSWAQDNESNIWRYFVENELLYSTDPKLAGRFINPAPFTKFNLELDNESPGRLGQYLGWQIVRAYMKNNDTPLQQMLAMEPEEIFNNSRFKPRR